MIKVIITGPARNGYFPYRVDWWFQGRPQLVGLSPAPLLDACRQLQQMGLMDSTVVGLYEREGDDDLNTWSFRTTVGEGATRMGKYREFIGGPIKEIPDPGEVTVAPPATPVAAPPEPRTPPEPPADTGRVQREPDRPDPPHHKRKRAGSGARRGSR